MSDTPIEPIVIEDFTNASQFNSDVEGNGVFDSMMNSIRANVYEEYEEGRITGTEYATVYLQAMNAAGDRALQFLLSKDSTYLEAKNLDLQGQQIASQVALAEMQLEIAREELKIKIIQADNEAAKINLEMDILAQQALLIPEQISQIQEEVDLLQTQDLIAYENLKTETAKANTALPRFQEELAGAVAANALTTEQINKVTEETKNTTYQGLGILKQTTKTQEETDLLKTQDSIALRELIIASNKADGSKLREEKEILNIAHQGNKLLEEIDLLQTQDAIALHTKTIELAKANDAVSMSAAELANLKESTVKTQEEIDLLEQQEQKVTQETLIAAQQLIDQTAISGDSTNRVAAELSILKAQHCKLQEEFNVLKEQKGKIIADASLVGAKTTTEEAQTSSTNIGDDSILASQRSLYVEQADAFKRDAEQKASKIMIDTYNVSKTVEPGIDGSPYGLKASNVEKTVKALLGGIGETIS